MRALERYASMFSLVCGADWQSPLLQRMQAAMRTGGSAPDRVRQLAALGGWSELRSGAALLHFPVQALTLWDFHVLFALERWRSRSGAHVRAWVDALGTFDALATVSVVRADEPGWSVPRVDPATDRLEADALGHPLIAGDRRVANDVRLGPPGTMLLVTGSNMSGKSTLLRAIGLNAVLAQTGAPVCAAAFTMPPCDLQSSIRVQDSLELGLSYFMAALARLKQVVDAAERDDGPTGPSAPKPGQGWPAPDTRSTSRRMLLYLLDEVLQGTNSVERAIAVRAVAAHLLRARAIGAMTTHDLALADEEPLKSSASLGTLHGAGSRRRHHDLRLPPSRRDRDVHQRSPTDAAHRHSTQMTRRRLASGAGLLGLFAVLTAVMTWPQVRELSTGATPHQDVYFNMWRMQWFAHAIATSPGRLFDANIFYPEHTTFAFSDAMLVTDAAAAPFIWAGVPGSSSTTSCSSARLRPQVSRCMPSRDI